MNESYNKKNKKRKIIIFINSLLTISGGERILYEEAAYFQKQGHEVIILTFACNKDLLFFVRPEYYQPTIYILDAKSRVKKYISLRRKIKELNPDIIISAYPFDCRFLYFATLFTKFSYCTHIYATMFWFTTQQDQLKYSYLYKRVFNEIRNSVFGHKEFIPAEKPNLPFLRKIILEIIAFLIHLSVRKARIIFTLSEHMRWEIKKLYGKDAVVIRGAYPIEVLYYTPKQDIKVKLGLNNKKMLLIINTLQPRKRVDLLIKSFKIVSSKINNCILVIGGEGPEKEKLKTLAKDIEVKDKVLFVGRIPERELWDYYASCDVYVCPNWADFVLTPYEALALGKKVVCSSEMEFDKCLENSSQIFIADPTVDDFAKGLEQALKAEVNKRIDKGVLKKYSWENFSQRILDEIELIIQ
jgi:glycosyltransferase involved in cell wall biosynthesis